MANSAPGKDRLEHRHLRLLDPRCQILAKMFRHCFLAKDVPASWKTANTILIHKKDSTSDASNFRPIALMSCLYKLLMAIIAKRMTSFSINNDLLSQQQKSARPSEGCYEHAFLLESIVNDARRQPRPLCLAWLDIRNAFGSVPHSAMLTTLTHMGFPPDLISMIGNVYTGATTEIVTPLGKTPSIPIHSGVKQGCPLSAFLFNLAVELIICKCIATKAETLPRGPLKHHGCPISILTYADDLVILARNSQTLQTLLDTVSSAANIVVRSGNKVIIIDVTCPFENDDSSLEMAAERKVNKYDYLIDHFQEHNQDAKVFGFVVGSLGAWFNGNENVLDELQINRRYRTLFRKLCCADAIRVSRNIYVQHLTGVPQ